MASKTVILRLPAGTGPFPVIILLHDCGGVGDGLPDWAARLNDWGYATLMPDSLTPRGVTSVCAAADQAKVTPWDRTGDVGSAVAWLRRRADIEPERIAVLGLAHGGMTAALVAQSPFSGFGLRAVVNYSGACVEPALHGLVPILALAGDADDRDTPGAPPWVAPPGRACWESPS